MKDRLVPIEKIQQLMELADIDQIGDYIDANRSRLRRASVDVLREPSLSLRDRRAIQALAALPVRPDAGSRRRPGAVTPARFARVGQGRVWLVDGPRLSDYRAG